MDGYEVDLHALGRPVLRTWTRRLLEMDTRTYIVWHDGDRSVGIGGDQAKVEMSTPLDAEEDAANREALKECFTQLWDFRAHVATEAELASETD